MEKRVKLGVTIKLLSDTIFGSGYSIPGGEDIAVSVDEKGFPYLKGSTLKGLLRESLENYISWTNGDENKVEQILGSAGWNGTSDEHRIRVTSFVLDDNDIYPDECFCDRTFTSLENGSIKKGTLRIASCICSGLSFSGEIDCNADDKALIENAVKGIKWAGTMRSRGFGKVKASVVQLNIKSGSNEIKNTGCIYYSLHTELPLFMTDMSKSYGNGYDTYNFISGSAIRGMVMSELASSDPAWFEENKKILLSERTRFLNAIPQFDDKAVIPSIKGFYEDKREENFQTVVKDGNLDAGLKRAKLGSFCAIENGKIIFGSPKISTITRIQRATAENEDSLPFQMRTISEGQDFSGYIICENDTVSEKIAEIFSGEIWIGADRYEGFGKCSVKSVKAVEKPAWIDKYSYSKQDDIKKNIYMVLLSPLSMLDNEGNHCGINETELARAIGLPDNATLKINFCSTSLSDYASYNRAWQCRMPAANMYDAGCIFNIECTDIPDINEIYKTEISGLGIRREEGFGQVLFLNNDIFEGITGKSAFKQDEESSDKSQAVFRRAKYKWISETAKQIHTVQKSKSQTGVIQALCEKAIAANSTKELLKFRDKNLNDRGVINKNKYIKIFEIVDEILDKKLSDLLKIKCDDSLQMRLSLLCDAFNYSRNFEE